MPSTVIAPQVRRGRPPLTEAEKARRGTLKPPNHSGDKAGIPLTRPADAPVLARDYRSVVRTYQAGVLSGRIVASVWLQRAVTRQAADIARGRRDRRWAYTWSWAEARAACHFIEQCPHTEGTWATPTIRLEPWQVWVVCCLFGWRVKGHRHQRRFSVLYLEVARKAAKSTLMAAIGLYHLLREGELGASVVCGATTGSQARVVFGIAQRMVFASPWLRSLGVRAFANSIVTVDGTIKPINSRASSQDGLNPSCIVLDESHAQDFELHDVLRSSQGARQNPLMLCPTTAGYNQLSVGYALRDRLTKVLKGVFEADHLFGAIWTLDDGDDWRDEANWVKANPMLGVTPTKTWLRQYCKDAQQSPQLEAEFRVKCCSQWANSASTWLSMTAWDACAEPTLHVEQFLGQPCWIGCDLAQLDDLAAVARVFQRGDALVAFVTCYLPAAVVADRARAVPEYRLWADRGDLVLTEGSMIDFSRIEADIRADCARFDVRDIAFDQFGSVQITGNLFNDGLPARMEQKNARTFAGQARELETRVTHNRFRHDGNTCLKWQASNVVVSRRIDDSLLPKKDMPESPNKIDAIDALLLAIGGVLKASSEPAPSYRMFVLGA